MSNNILFWCNRGGAIILLFLFGVVFPAQKALAQDLDCLDASCNRLRVEVLRETTPTSSCNAFSAESCGFDRFNQVAYTVYLRQDKFIPAGEPILPYNLAYDMLDVTLNLNDTPFSHIDAGATLTCFTTGLGAKWQYNPIPATGNKAIFSSTDKSVAISFANLEANSPDCGIFANNTGNVITFSYTDLPSAFVEDCPAGRQCAYAKLFTVIVNAYPGENISFNFSQSRYVPNDGGTECNMSSSAMNPGGKNGLFPTTVVHPVHYTNTNNENIRAELGSIASILNNQQEMPIILRNFGATTIDISYLEFMLKAVTSNIEEPFEYTLVDPRVSTSGGGGAPLITNLHYVIPNAGYSLDPGDMMTIGTIKFKEPDLENLNWAVDFSFQNSGADPAKSRIKTSGASNICTSLNILDLPRTKSPGDDEYCSDPSIRFKVEGVGLDCGTSKVKVGLRTTAPPANIRLNRVEFELEFNWSASDVALTGLNYTSWPSGIDCSTIGCYIPSGSGPKVCWQGINSKTFKYCYETDDLHATAFYLDDLDEMEILFNTPGNACIESVRIKKISITYALNNDIACVPIIDPPTGFPLCGSTTTMLTGNISTENLVKVEAVSVELSGAVSNAMGSGMADCSSVSCSSPCSAYDLTDVDGVYQFSCMACTTCNKVKVVPTKDDNPLNGVTTYDLVLISKHHLAIEPLNSPYKMIAADANKSGSITTFDIVEFRKLILGIYLDLPNNTSWRFVDKAFVFPNSVNPFQTVFPEGINCLNFPSSANDFVAVKIGDVNNTAIGNRPVERPLAGLSWPNMRCKAGEVITIPVRYTGTETMEAIQLGLRFDPTKLQLIGPSVGDLEGYLSDNFNLLQAAAGEIRTLWFPMTMDAMPIQSGNVLFYLSFKVLEASPNGVLPLWLDNQLLDCASWKQHGECYSIQQQTATAQRDEPALVASALNASVLPNPTSGGVTLTVQAVKAEKCRAAIFDAFGQMLLFREFELREGQQDIPLPEVAPLPAGVYTWKIYTQSLETQGQLIKQ